MVAVVAVFSASCGVDGDPGHCFISIEWEYFSEDYGVYYYEDNNPDIPKYGVSKGVSGKGNSYFDITNSDFVDSEEIVAGHYYESYPGKYDYYYESEDSPYWYKYTGSYELIQNPGTPGGIFHDGLDGTDTYIELFLNVHARKGLGVVGGLPPHDDDLSARMMAGKEITTLTEDIPARNSDTQYSRSGRLIIGEALHIEESSWQIQDGEWQLHVEEKVMVFRK